MRKLNCLGSICFMSLHGIVLSLVFSYLVYALCLSCATAMARCLLSSKWWISSETILRLFFVVSFDHHCCGWRLSLAFPVATEPITSFILREDSAISKAYLVSHFWPVIMAGCVLFTSGSKELCSIWKSYALPNLNSSTSDFVGSFNFIDELHNATFVKDLGTSNHFFRNLLIKCSLFSILESDTSYICIGHANLGIKPK